MLVDTLMAIQQALKAPPSEVQRLLLLSLIYAALADLEQNNGVNPAALQSFTLEEIKSMLQLYLSALASGISDA